MIFGGVKIYTVQLKPEDGLLKRPIFIREGINWYAFVLTGFWMLYHRLWVPLLGILLFHSVTIHLWHAHVILKVSYLAIQLGFHFFIAFQANDWLRTKLTKQGYLLADVSAADSLLRAEQRYYERTLAAQGL